MELYLHSHNTSSWRGAQLKHRYTFTFYLKLCVHAVLGHSCCCDAVDYHSCYRQRCNWSHITL